MSFKAKVKAATSALHTAYENNIIPYPRVENSLITIGRFEMFPHPPMTPSLSILKPLDQDEFDFNKENSLLYLATRRLAKPSEMDDLAEIIDMYFEDDFRFRSNALAETASAIIGVYDTYLEEVKLKDKPLLRLQGEFYEAASDTDGTNFSLFKTKELFFETKQPIPGQPKKPSPLKSMLKWAEQPTIENNDNSGKKLAKDDELSTREENTSHKKNKIQEFDTVEEGLEEFRRIFARRSAVVQIHTELTSALQSVRSLGNTKQ